jgi:AcrR family transcriptional regulator
MDLRIYKTKKNIKSAFLELRSKKKLDKISVTELAKIALISKATFYLHYKDIYDLSEKLEDEFITNCLNAISEPEILLSPKGFLQLVDAFFYQDESFKILFSDTRSDVFITKYAKRIKELVYEAYPEFKDNLDISVLLSFTIYGALQTFLEYYESGKDNLANYRIANILEHSLLELRDCISIELKNNK